VAKRHDPAVELALDHCAELDGKRGIAAGQILYLRCRHSRQDANIVSCIGLISMPASIRALRTDFAMATAAGLSP